MIFLLIFALAFAAYQRGKRAQVERDLQKLEMKTAENRYRKMTNEYICEMTLTEFLDSAEAYISTAYKSDSHKQKLRCFLRDLKDSIGILHIPRP